MSVSNSNNRALRSQGNSGGAESGAFSDDSPEIDPELAKVMGAWPDLPDAIKAGILAMVKANEG